MSKVLIDFVTQSAAIQKTIDLLEKTGDVSKKNAQQFKQNNADYKKAAEERNKLINQELSLISDLEKRRKKAFDPDAIRAYNDDIRRAKDNVKVLKGETDKAAGSLSKLNGTLKNIAVSAGIAFGTAELIAFGKEAVALAAKGEGIRTAFQRTFGNTEENIKKLRTATRGAVSDIDLMSQALQAGQLGVRADVFAKGLEFVGKIARQTGQDVDFLAQSMVDGLGRQSLRRIDNLGISMKQMRDEMKSAGVDFQQAFANIVERRMVEMGAVIETTADKTARLSAMWQNFKEAIGADLITKMDKASEGLKAIFGGAEGRAEVIARGQAQAITRLVNVHGDAYREMTSVERKAAIDGLIAKEGKNKLEIEILKEYTRISLDEEKKRAAQTGEIDEKALKEAQKRAEALAKWRADQLRKEIDDNKKATELMDKLLFDALKIENERRLIEVEKGSEEELQIKIENLERVRDYELTLTGNRQEQLNLEAQFQNDKLKLQEEWAEEQDKSMAKFAEERHRKEAKLEEEHQKQLAQIKQTIQQESFETSLMFLSTLQGFNDTFYEENVMMLQRSLEQGAITQEEFDKQERDLMRRAAGRDKLLSIFNIGVKTAEGVMNYLSNPITAPAVPLVLAQGALQAALVAARPIPFAEGTKSVEGGEQGKDSVHALLMPGEMVVPTKKKKKYEPVLNAIFDETISPDVLNALALGQTIHKATGQTDEYAMARGMKSALRDGVYVKNMPTDRGMSEMEFKLRSRRGT